MIGYSAERDRFKNLVLFRRVGRRTAKRTVEDPGLESRGANIGIFTMLCALNGEHVVAYEPNLAAYNMMLETIRRNKLEGSVIPICAAICW
jgi:hypothetical protein